MLRSSRARVEDYRARRPLGALLLVIVLGGIAALVWWQVLDGSAHGCQRTQPVTAAVMWRLPANGLDAVPPAPPQLTRVQVLNAGGVRGAASVADATLAQLGFAPTSRPANDPRYPDFNLRCYGEIRFGAAGQAEARTLSLALPCADLVRDDRPGAEIDLALGTKFGAVRPNDAARSALLALAESGYPELAGPTRGGLAAEPGSEALGRTGVNPELLRLARQAKC
ncbi:MAG TPA: envelope integrity protein Cei [Pseudonocardiaceae bacterium]|nr:envelope integrity protein Cei [Pseudonocardiaceae bacterium]